MNFWFEMSLSISCLSTIRRRSWSCPGKLFGGGGTVGGQ